ncbi:VIT1/CCC1 family predicted Fe2+/Mn2+ transporter [Nitrosomonas nitrosa]|uniref:Predicted Fe2+/Mn2+ transporter, VIT1/CCC1 family n=1 Tax=Nitrosomonas nitrosa TaxID=52442 RepID=A0A8H8YY37_9PROT|nr:VIT family protein [Nitrosomonas nitrosa]PTR04884.1 VIT1/CCC1 family predicted Fe2+/Mn2+ transporter [Nitrosomonas nitrosa]CAE6486201.1 Predicted Fe2+/Mn2+ transporter, VIT1/CCC1 family [Nitrosomonas nitrosa]
MNRNEEHRSHRTGWLRAAVLGANDGIVSTASLIIGVAAANAGREEILLAGVAGLVAGAMSMAAGEYVSVSSQADTEKADIALEQRHLSEDIGFEFQELVDIYVSRGLQPELAREVAKQLMTHDALDAHLRDELGIYERIHAQPLQAALTSAGTFTLGASMPLIATFIAPITQIILTVSIVSLFSLAILGALAAYLGGAKILVGSLRVIFWGILAMVLTAAVGSLFGVVV